MSGKITHELRYANKLHHGMALSPRAALEAFGPTVPVRIGVHPAMAKKLQAEGKPVPPAIAGDAMIDTGAQVTTIDMTIAERLQLPRTGKTIVAGIGGLSEGYTSPISVTFPGLNNMTFHSSGAHCHDLIKNAKHIIALIGRDLLKGMTFFFDGVEGEARLAYILPPGAVVKKGSAFAQQRPKEKRNKRNR